MELKPNCDSDRAWVWSVPSDFADETPTPELFAVRFANAESSNLFFCFIMWYIIGSVTLKSGCNYFEPAFQPLSNTC